MTYMTKYGVEESYADIELHISPWDHIYFYAFDPKKAIPLLHNLSLYHSPSSVLRLLPISHPIVKKIEHGMALPPWKDGDDKGKYGEMVFSTYCQNHSIQFTFVGREEQIKGYDFIVGAKQTKIEVKFDGPIPKTGKLALQIHECHNSHSLQSASKMVGVMARAMVSPHREWLDAYETSERKGWS
ncbi:MAG: hypothetical protein WBR29_08625 [Gammaproteobacteria bacterium]